MSALNPNTEAFEYKEKEKEMDKNTSDIKIKNGKVLHQRNVHRTAMIKNPMKLIKGMNATNVINCRN